jgi:hypothetical protein
VRSARAIVATLGHRLESRGRRLWRWLFPPRVEPPVEAMAVLRAVYPALDLDAVAFHHGIPHLIRHLGSQAIVIPALLARRRTCVYLAPHAWDFRDADGLGTLLHEGYHALQVQDAGWGIAPFRPFVILYFARGAANGFRYRGHPMEEAAFVLAGESRSRFETASARGEVEPPGLAVWTSGVRFWRDLAASVPLAPAALARAALPFWLLAWALAAFLVWLARLAVEAVGGAAAAVLMGMGFFVKSLANLLYLND